MPARGPHARPDLVVDIEAREREHELEPRAGAGCDPAPKAFREVEYPVVRPGPLDPIPPLLLEGVKLDDPFALTGAVRGEEGSLGELARTKTHRELHPEPGGDRAEVLVPVTGGADVGV